MSVITITRGIYSRGKEIAEKVAHELGYECIGDEVLQSASKEYEVSESKILKAFHDAPSFLSMSEKTREQYIAYVQAVLARHLMKDRVVYYGPAGHLLIQGVSHVLKVLVLANFEDRIRLKIERDGVSEKDARKAILKEDKEHKRWAKALYGIEDTDPSLYDLVINIGQIDVQEAIKIITNTVKSKRFQPMTYSIKCMENIELSSRVRALLVDMDPDVKVRSDDGNVYIYTKALEKEKEKRVTAMTDIVKKISDVKHVEVHVTEDIFKKISATAR